MKKELRKILYTVCGAALFVTVWWIAAIVYDKELIFPTPTDALREMGDILGESWFWRSFFLSLLRSFIGFACACALALICAFAGKAVPAVKSMLAPIIGILRSLPTMSVILLFVLWAGGELTPVLVAGLVIFPVLYSGIDAALSSVPRELEETARLYSGSAAYRFFKLYLPMSAPAFLHVAGGAASLTLKLTVAAEVLAQTRDSLGLIMQQTRIYFQIGRLMAITVIVVLASLIIEFAVFLLRKAVDYN